MKKQLRIHYFQHEPYEGPGCIEDWTKKEGHLLSCTQFFEGQAPPDLADIDMLVIMGGSMGIYDEKDHPWLTHEKRSIKEVVKANKPVIGICLGAQLLADALGAKVNHGKYKEIGWLPVRKTEAGKATPLLHDMPDQLTVFHWHGDQFDIPEGCRSLAESDGCSNQLFLFGDRVIGIQFHFEATAATIGSMLSDAGEELEDTGIYVRTKSETLSGLHFAGQNNEIMFTLLDKLSLLIF